MLNLSCTGDWLTKDNFDIESDFTGNKRLMYVYSEQYIQADNNFTYCLFIDSKAFVRIQLLHKEKNILNSEFVM